MPRLAKSVQRDRDQGVIRGIRKHLAGGPPVVFSRVPYTAAELEAFFADHLAAMARVDELTRERSQAVAEERALEARLAPIYAAIKKLAASRLGEHSAAMRDYGMEPAKIPKMTAETKKRANEKRQETRRLRGIGGKKKRVRRRRSP